MSLVVGIPGIVGKDTRPATAIDEDRERAPLLDDH